MFNLIKMDIYRLFKSKSFYLIFLILALLCGTMYYTLADFMNDPNAGMVFDALDPKNPKMLELLSEFFRNSMIQVLIVIGVSIYVCADYSSGYIKNIASIVTNKANIAVSKLITWIIGSLIYYILLILLIYILGNVLIGDVAIGNVSEIFQYIGMSFFQTTVIVALTIAATSFFRNSAACITAGVIALQFSSIIYFGIKSLFGIDLVPYSIANNITTLSIRYSDSWNTLLISGTICLLVYMTIACGSMMKKDVK